MHSTNLAPVALSCGEPSGIGPELAETAWEALKGDLPFAFIGDPTHLPGGVPHEVISDMSAAKTVSAHALPVLPIDMKTARVPGVAQPEQAAGVIKAIEMGVELAKTGAASGLCTLPIHKKALQDGAGFAYPGHTEFLCDLAGADEVVMMLASDELRVVPVTIHISLDEVPQALTVELLEKRIRITHTALRDQFGINAPRLAVAGLNPHAGEGGKMGLEEINLIIPVLEKLRGEGMDLRGPLPGDTMFHARARQAYDVAICMYHDQALIPIKTLDFDRGVNVTLGLPFLRTSPDHGTAFDIAGKGMANVTSTVEALKLVWKLAGSAL